MTEVKGSCHCGNVSYAVHGNIVSVVNCHCELCRSLCGAAFASYVVVRQLELSLQGQESLVSYTATDKATRHFCKICGTPIFNTNPVSYPSLVMLYLGTVASSANLTPKLNVFCESKLPWVDGMASITGFPQAVSRKA